ncbi:MAG: 4Fe-4S binding protein [Candidatus Bathyarchaeota archaeon]|nr:4Fe-4S binding protein [Candidatus Bathyarchaeota archaeon]
MLTENYSTIVIVAFAAATVVGIFLVLKLTKSKTNNISNLRLFVQIVAVVAIFMGVLVGPFNDSRWLPLSTVPRDRLVGEPLLGNQFPDGLSVPVLACYYPHGRTVTCPIWQLQAYIFPFWETGIGYDVFYTTSGPEKLVIVVSLVVAMSVVLGRFFCGWLCPFGLYMDLLTKIRYRFGKKHLDFSEQTNKKLGQLRYIIIAVFLVFSVVLSSHAIFGTELIPGTIPGGPQGTEAGIVGYINEPFCLICPMRPLSLLAESAVGLMSLDYMSQITYGPFAIAGHYITSINISVLILVTALSIIYRRFWCRICPLGGLTALLSTFTPFKQIALTRLHKDELNCTKCGICKRVCPTQVTEIYTMKGGDVTVSGCMLCFRCVEMCPETDALRVKFAGKTVFKSRNWLESK